MVVLQGATLKVPPDVVRTDLDTDWVPDPWGWADIGSEPITGVELLDRSAREPLHDLLVPFVGGRRRRVPLLGHATRALLTGAAAALVRSRQHRLAEGVFGYLVDEAGQFIHYRDELARRRGQERRLQERFPVIATADVRRFFRSVSLGQLQLPSDAPPAGVSELDQLLGRFERELGYVLPEGYAAARGLANLALSVVDDALSVPFTRWLDDYRLYCKDGDEAQRELNVLREAAAAVGFQLAEGKTSVGPASAQEPGADASLGDHADDDLSPSDALRALRHCRANVGERDRKGRFALRMAAETRDESVVSVLLEDPADAIPPAWLPRIAWVIASCPTPESAKLLVALWHAEDEFTEWRRLRLAPSLWYLPAGVSSNLDLLKIYEGLPPARPAVARVLARHHPSQMRRLPPPVGAEEERARHLGDVEAVRRSPANSLETAAVAAGPPMASFL